MPFRRSRAKPDTDGFYQVVAAERIPDGGLLAGAAGDEPIVLTRTGDEIRAFGRYCPHASGDFSRGERVRHKLICPEHDYSFDLETGALLWPPDDAYCLMLFDVRVRDGLVYARPSAPRKRRGDS